MDSMETHAHTHTRCHLRRAKLRLTRLGANRLNANRVSCCSGPFWDKITGLCDREGSELTRPHLSCSPFGRRGQRRGGREGGLRTEIPKQGARTEVREETRDWLQCEATVATLSFHHYDTIAETGRQGKPFCFASVAC